MSPKTLFKIMVYAYMNNIYTTRGIEQACRSDINFMWLLEGQKAPNHNTISRFRSERLVGIVEDLFNQLVNELEKSGEVAFENLYIDGTKIEANANKYSFVWKKATTKNAEKLRVKICKFILQLNEDFGFAFSEAKPLEEIREVLRQKKESEEIRFVYGKGQRKTTLQKAIETLENF